MFQVTSTSIRHRGVHRQGLGTVLGECNDQVLLRWERWAPGVEAGHPGDEESEV